MIYLHCISKIIPKEFIKNNIILNAHPGILPLSRGVDSFKWSVIKKIPLGVTLHKIDENIDCGLILKRSLIPIQNKDTLYEIAKRSFDTECYLLSNFGDYFKNINKKIVVSNKSNYFSNKINSKDEARLLKIFKSSIKDFQNLYKKFKKKFKI